MADKETVRLLAVVLDGFGYRPLECHQFDRVFEHLSKTTPFAALVDMQMDQAEQICKLVIERGGIRLLILLPEDQQEPEEQVRRFQADDWESVSAGPEKLLLTLRKLANQGKES